MYTDHKKGLNLRNANKARMELFIRNLNVSHEFSREFDEYGDVKRDYVNEIRIFAQHETETLIPQVDSEYFYTFHNFHLHLKNNIDITPDVKILPSLPRVKVQAKQPLLARVRSKLKSPYPKLTMVLRSISIW